MRLLATSGSLGEALAHIAEALRVPVLVLALIVLLVCAVELGRFATELWVRRRSGRGGLLRIARQSIAEPGQAAALSQQAPSAFAARAVLEIARAASAGESEGVEYALADYELAVQRRLDRTRILVRAGPALGLMGTLIPLAPGLAALGHGEVSTLATDLRTAFAATVVGLLVGTIAFALTLTRTRMYTEDLAALERAAATVLVPGALAAPAIGERLMARTGLGRHGRIEDGAGDPLDGLVNLFDIGIVLAVAFLIVGLGLTLNTRTRSLQPRAAAATAAQTLPSTAGAPHASGRGEPVGTVYRLSNGSLVLVKPREAAPGAAATPAKHSP